MTETIITAQDVVSKTPLHSDTNLHVICDYLDCERISMECFGDTYDAMLEDALQTRKQQSENEEYKEGTEYETGSKVLYCGICYERTGEAGTGDPDCTKGWEECERFSSECYNEIWRELCSYLAWYIYGQAVPFLHVKAGEGGVIVPNNDRQGGEGADKEWLEYLCGKIYKQCGKKLRALKNKIIKICDTGECAIEFRDIPFVNPANCDPECKQPDESEARRIVWRKR